MKVSLILLVVSIWLPPTLANSADGLITVPSPYPVKVTLDRFEGAAKEAGMTVFLRLDHAAGAEKAGKSLRPTELLIFGNPKGGTALMQCAQTVGIDLPLKALAWEDESGQVHLAYSDVRAVAARHAVKDCPAIEPIQTVLDKLSTLTLAQ